MSSEIDVLEPSIRFATLRPRLLGIAYRMLGTLSEAEEVVQDAWIKLQLSLDAGIENVEAWLVSVTTRAAIDRLRSAKVEREHYAGLWLPEPLLVDRPVTPEERLEQADQVSLALLLMLERLTPEARAAFLLREIFDVDYDEIARTLGKSAANCRQLVRRARLQLQEVRPRQEVSEQEHLQLLMQFANAATSGDFRALRATLADDATLIGDGGGKVTSFGRPLVGNQRIAQLFYAGWLRFGNGAEFRVVRINDRPGLVRFIDGELESVQSFETAGGRIATIHVQRNPDKIARFVTALKSPAADAPARREDTAA